MDNSGTAGSHLKEIKQQMQEKISWPLVKKIATGVFFALVAWLLVKQATTIEWGKVFATLKETSPVTLLTGFAIGLLCYGVYSSYDLFGRYLLDVKKPVYKVWYVAWLSYAFNLNLGAIVGGVAFRYRLYSRLGVDNTTVTRIIGLSVATNWLGYVLLAGGLFVSGQISPPDNWIIGKLSLQILGAVFLLVVAAYVGACAFSRKREFSLRSFTMTLPGIRVALLQLLASCAHWTLMATVIYQFTPDEIAFPTVFAVLLVSAVAGAVTHIPGGLGVLEAVFVTLLAGEVEKSAIIAGLFAYRCVFYLAPLALATPLYFIFETATRGRGKPDT